MNGQMKHKGGNKQLSGGSELALPASIPLPWGPWYPGHTWQQAAPMALPLAMTWGTP